MANYNLKTFIASAVVLGFFVVVGVVVLRGAAPLPFQLDSEDAGLAFAAPLAPVPQKAVERPTLDLWPLFLTLRHIKAFSGSGWENFYSQMASIAAQSISAQPAALKKLAGGVKTDKTVVPSYRLSIAALLSAIANRVQGGNLRITAGTKFEHAVPPVASLAEFLKLGLLPKAVTASLQKTVASLPKLSVEEQMQKLAETTFDLQKNKTIPPSFRNITWELHAITAFILSGESQTVLCADLAGETAPATVAACNAQGGAVYDAQCPSISLFASEEDLSTDDRGLSKLIPSASASGGNLDEYEKPDNKFTNCEKAVQYACVYSEIWKRPYTPGKYICGDFALDMKEGLWNVIKGKISIREGKAPTKFVLDEKRYQEALRKLRSGEGPGVVNIDFMVEKPMEKPDPRIKITGASTDLAPSLTHFFNDAECTDENGKSQKIYFDAASCEIYDTKIAKTIFSEHVISEKNKYTGEAFMRAIRERDAKNRSYWQKKKLEEIRDTNPKQIAEEGARLCWDRSSDATGYPQVQSWQFSSQCPDAFIGYCRPGPDPTVYWNFIGVRDETSLNERVVIACAINGAVRSGQCVELERAIQERTCPS